MRSALRYRVPADFFDETRGYPRARSLHVRRVRRSDDEYPALLREVSEAPESLWVAGRNLASMGVCVAVIGARQASTYGLTAAHRIAADLAAAGVCVVSGLARGADAAAHDGALEAGGATVAVIGSETATCYPRSSKNLYAEISQRGAIVSPYPPGSDLHGGKFLYRNRVLVGMSHAVVVAQGAANSAAVKTGRLAVDLNQTVFAVPGSTEWALSAGVHALIKEGAKLCTSADDVLKVLAEEVHITPVIERAVPQHLPEPHRLVLEALRHGPATRGRILARTGLNVAKGSGAIVALEVAGYIGSVGTQIHRIR